MPLFDLLVAGLVVLTFALHRYVVPAAWRVWLLIAASAGFVAYLDLAALAVVAGLGAFTYLGAAATRRIGSAVGRRLGTVGGVLVLAGALAYYKYWAFLLTTLGLPAPKASVWAPLGISFLVFRLIAYFLDQQQPKAERLTPSGFALFVLFFPTYIAGPLHPWKLFARGAPEPPDLATVAQALERILYGAVKKIVLADQLGTKVMELGVGPELPSQGIAWLLVFAYGWRIYFDFAAYSDIAIGLARLFGYPIMENFRSPFLARGPIEFWKRWHISLSEWLQFYVFLPVSKRALKSRLRRHKELTAWIGYLTTFVLCGIWHGAGWNFVLWGLYHGLGVCVNHLWGEIRKRQAWAKAIAEWRGAGALSLAMNYCFVSYSFLLFVHTVPQTIGLTRRLFGLE